ncbi:GHMP kinase [Streptomyces sp. B6B3]|uniref:GHMP family kinase ATP-binding protein n=1 Tax=Streptomyces sp. B6B3 TaxID=3153570 RepID=UPI00325CF28E
MTATGAGHAACHHGEILQGVFRDRRGARCLGLVTLPVPGVGSRAEFERRPGTPPEDLAVLPADRTRARRAAALAVAECARRTGRPPCGGRLRLRGGVPVGRGMGSSTSDVIAAVRAVAASFGTRLPPAAIAELAVRVERASDPLMLDGGPLLFAQREGRVLEVLGAALPPVVVLGCATGGGRPVDTLSVPADRYGERDVRAFERLRALLRRAVAAADPVLLGHVCTASARRHQRLLPKEELPLLTSLAAAAGAVGVQVAHSGSVAGLLFDARSPDLDRQLRRCARDLANEGLTPGALFATRPHPPAPALPTALTAPATVTATPTSAREGDPTCSTTSRRRSPAPT